LRILSLAEADICRSEVSLVFDDSAVTGVLFQTVIREEIDESIGWSEDFLPVALLLTEDLSERLLRHDVTRLAVADLNDDFHNEAFFVREHRSNWQFSAPVINSSGRERRCVYGVMEADGLTRHVGKSDDGGIRSVFAGDLIPWLPNDEIILSGDCADLAGLHFGRQAHVACYNFSGNHPEEIWYREMEGFRFDRPLPTLHQLAGVRDSSIVLLLDIWSGTTVDSLDIDRRLGHVQFFETTDPTPAANLIGLSHDTLFVYRIESATDRPFDRSESSPELPPTFILHQNYPNPFNGSTQLRFTNLESQRLSLKVFNVLGQEIATLMDGYFGPGDYEANWTGNDQFGAPQASGIYFAQLRSDTRSQIIKLIYLK
ncbi:T9SS type A sorting domain-containing protein, partial [candidate division GN15 bacterium]|nr:T9SS type A sorting domain-containing protein [candidate division GN15 bacterium]